MTLSPSYYTSAQNEIVNLPFNAKVFLRGWAGTGKTTVGVGRLYHLLEEGIPGNQVLVLVPQRTLATPYYDLLRSTILPAGSMASILTIGGLARRMVALYWPLIAEGAGFRFPDKPPVFLTLETAQYYMAHIVRPHLDEGFFDSVTMSRNRLYSQILDNLNKAAVHGFPHTEIEERLRSAWIGDPGQVHVYEDSQICANEFRKYCLDNNLLDFSLQLTMFSQHLWNLPVCKQQLLSTYQHMIFDNLEEDTPVTADLLSDWIPNFQSTLMIFDQSAGYRRFLGADPVTTSKLAKFCDHEYRFSHGFVSTPGVSIFGIALNAVLAKQDPGIPVDREETKNLLTEQASQMEPAITIPQPAIRFFPDMLDWVAEQISLLVDQGTPPGEIVVIAPYLSDALRYALAERLDSLGIPSHSHRPSRSLRDEPATRCLLTLAKIAHPQWGMIPLRIDVTYALIQAFGDMDLVRADLLSQIVYKKTNLIPFEDIPPDSQERITYLLGGRYDYLRTWISNYIGDMPQELDHFLSRLFGEVLSQPGYGFHTDYNAGAIAASLIESVQKFRWVTGDTLKREGIPLGKEYIEMVDDGVIASQYLAPWQFTTADSVFLAPAYTFLMSNRPVDFQFWLDVGGRGWYERLYQPLTHPYVLHRGWPVGKPWTDVDEAEAGQDMLYRLSYGLVQRCRLGIYLGISELSEQGYEHKGDLLRAIDKVFRMIVYTGKQDND